MSTSVVPATGGGRPARKSRARARLLAVIAVVSIVALIDSEIIAYGVPGIQAGANLLHLPAVVDYVAFGLLGLLTLWLTVWLARQVWRVEHELDAAQDTPTAC